MTRLSTLKHALEEYLSVCEATEFGIDHERLEAELASKLKAISEEDRLEILNETLLNQSPVLCMRIAELCIEKQDSMEAILVHGIRNAGSGQISFWVKHGLRYLSIAKMRSLLHDAFASNAEMDALSEYWLRTITVVTDSE